HHGDRLVTKKVDHVVKGLELRYDPWPLRVAFPPGLVVRKHGIPPVARLGDPENRNPVIPNNAYAARDVLLEVREHGQEPVEHPGRPPLSVLQVDVGVVLAEDAVHRVDEDYGFRHASPPSPRRSSLGGTG